MVVRVMQRNLDNIKKSVRTFDGAVNDLLPTVAQECGLDPREFEYDSYAGDEGGGLWGDFEKQEAVALK